MAHFRKLPHRYKKNHADISYTSRAIAIFIPNFVAMAMGVSQGKMRLAAFDGPSPKSCQNLLRKLSYSQFCLKFCCHDNGGRSGENAIGGIWWPIPENPLLARKNLLRKPRYSQFCPKFHCHGNRGHSGEDAIFGIRWPIPENFPIGVEKSLMQAKL